MGQTVPPVTIVNKLTKFVIIDPSYLPQKTMNDNFDTEETLATPEDALATLFEKEMGVPLNQAMETYNKNYILANLGEAWDASPKQVASRIETIKGYVEKLNITPEAKLGYTTLEGVQKAWNEIAQVQAQGMPPKATTPTGFLATSTPAAPPSKAPKITNTYEQLVKAPTKEAYDANFAEYAAQLQAQYFDKHLRG